jgi:hypothetical protein
MISRWRRAAENLSARRSRLTDRGASCYGPHESAATKGCYEFSRRPARAGIAGFVGALFSTESTSDAQSLGVPYVSLSPKAGPLWIAYEAGLFKHNNVGTELLYIPGGSTIIQAIMSKELPEAAKLNIDNFIDNTILAELEKSGFIEQIYKEPAKK